VSLNFATEWLRISGRLSYPTTIGRREIFLWTTVALFGNEVFQLVDAQSLSSLLVSLETQNYILWLAGYAFVFRVCASSPERPANQLDFWFSAATCLSILLTSFLPHKWGLGLIATNTAIYLLFGHRGDYNLKAAGCLLMAISAHLIWGPIFFQLLTAEIARADATIVAGILKSLRPDIVWRDTSFFAGDGHKIILVGACSSFQNISIALLACVTVTMLSRTEWVRRDIITIVLAIATMIMLNAVRLCLLAWSSSYFKFWHNGDGVNIFVFGQSALVLLMAWWGAATWRPAP
jgi:exosortase/archaeosortase family protein